VFFGELVESENSAALVLAQMEVLDVAHNWSQDVDLRPV